MKFIKISTCFCAFCFIGLCSAWAEAQNRLLSIVSTADEETQMMAMVLTMQSLQQGKDVHVLLCGKAGYLATDLTESRKFLPPNQSPRDLLKRLQANGATVSVCAIFLPNRDLDESDLRAGIHVAAPAAVAEMLGSPEVNVLSF